MADLATDGEITPLFEGAIAFDSLAWDGAGLIWAIEMDAEPGATDSGAEGAEAGEAGGSRDAADADAKAKGDSGNRLLVIDAETGEIADVTPRTDGADVEQFAIAPDGARIALVIDGAAYLAIVERDPDRLQEPDAIQISGLRKLHIADLPEQLGAVAWYDSDELALLTAPESPSTEEINPALGEAQRSEASDPAVLLAGIDRLVAQEDGPIPNGISMAAPTVDNRLAVGTSENEVWIRSELGRWLLIEDATAPAYAG